MLRLSDLIRSDVVSSSDQRWGRLADVSVHLDRPGGATVDRLFIRHRGVHLVTSCGEIDLATLATGTIRLLTDESPRAADHDRRPLAEDELLLRRDVLDTQIIDVKGSRVSRVGDVLLAVTDRRVTAVAVEVGGGSLIRRLGLRRLADARREQAVDWQDLHLTSDRGHLVQCRTTAALVHRLDAEQLAELVARLPSQHAVEILATVPPERAGRALELSHPHVRSRFQRLRTTDLPAPPRWSRLRGWDRHRGPIRDGGANEANGPADPRSPDT
jgi:sporulation protein YlmC with PRC-barrel domain